MPRPPAKSLSAIKLTDDAYKADFEIADKYQAFSSELVRLSLLGIAGYGFIFSTLPPKVGTSASAFATHLRSDLGLLVSGIVVLGLASGAGLAHRFFSTDCLTHQVTILRLLSRTSTISTPTDLAENQEWLQAEREAQHADLGRCRLLLQISATLLFLGAAITIVAFGRAVSSI